MAEDRIAVPINEQGPNEQSIVASGMTVEQWKKLHPGEPLGPEPEEIDQVTTDPPDGSPPSDEASLKMAEYFNPAVGVEGHPARAEAEQKLRDAAIARGEDVDQLPGDNSEDQRLQDTGTPEFTPGQLEPAPGTEYSSFTSHAQIDDWVQKNNIQTPDNWSGMTISSKKSWLDGNG